MKDVYKTDDEILPVSVDFTNRLPTAATVSSASVIVLDGEDTIAGMIHSAATYSGKVVTAYVKGGTPGKNYKMLFAVNFTGGGIAQKYVPLRVR